MDRDITEEEGVWNFRLRSIGSLQVDFEVWENPEIFFELSYAYTSTLREGIGIHVIEDASREAEHIVSLLGEEGGFAKLRAEYGTNCRKVS